jgi:predicted GH43/DUF377 family glycosyl hydrolase
MSRFIISLFAVTAIITQVYSQTTWTKDPNPVLPKGSSGEWDSNIVENPYVLFDGAVYHMWYAGSDGTGLRIGYAHSSDGINWTKYDDPTTTTPPYAESDPVLFPGPTGSWDEGHVLQPFVIFDGTSYHMWYGGTNDNLTTRNIGYATAPDSIHWTKYVGNPVLTPGPEVWDSQWVDSPNLLFINGVYHMWHSGSDGTIIQTGHATSFDGLTWAKDTLNPVLPVGSPGSWDDTWASLPFVLFDGSIYHMWYSGSNGTGFDWSIGYATSSDGRHWDKDTTHNPVLEPGLSGSWDDTYVGQSSVIFNNDSTQFNMWYGGGTGFAIGEIGYATAPISGIKVLDKNLPNDYVLHQNYPNPFNPTTNIEFSISKSGFVALKVYNILGEEVANLVSEQLTPGKYKYDWDASALASAVYLYRLEAGDYVEVKKMVLMK